MYNDANSLHDLSMTHSVPYSELKFDRNVKLEDRIYTPDVSDIGYFVEVDLKTPDEVNENSVSFSFAPVNKNCNPDNFTPYKNENKPITYTQTRNLLSDLSDEKKYLIHYKMSNYQVRHGKVVDKVHEIFSFRQSKWLKYK